MALTEFDRQLIKRCIAEESGAWKDLVDRFIGLIVHVINHTAHARSVRITQEDVDDLCSEVFLALLANKYAVLRNFSGKSSLATYLTVIARRVVVREIARRRMAEAFGHVNASPSSLEKAHVSPAREVQRLDDREEIRQMLEGLPPMEAEVVRLYHLENKSYREISQELGVAENSVGPTLSRARENLKQRKVGH